MGKPKDSESNPLLKLDLSKCKIAQWYKITFQIPGEQSEEVGYTDDNLIAQLCNFMMVKDVSPMPIEVLKRDDAIYTITPVIVLISPDSSAYVINEQRITSQIDNKRILSLMLQDIMGKLQPIEQKTIKAVIDRNKVYG